MEVYIQMEMSFRKFVEEAEEVLKIIQSSPNHQANAKAGLHDDQFWGRYQKRWGIHGDFVERSLPVSYLEELVRRNKVHISRIDEKEVQAKQLSMRFNKVIITRSTDSAAMAPLVIVDGTHSFAAASRLKQPRIDVIVSRDALHWLGLGEHDEPISI